MKNCWWYKKKLQFADTVSADLQRHLNNCADCRQLFEQRMALENELRQAAPEAQRQAPPYFLDRVARTCQGQDNYAHEETSHSPWKMAIALVILLAAVCVGVSVYRMDHQNQTAPDIAHNDFHDVPIEPSTTPMELPKVSLENPLMHELGLLASDATNAVQMLAQNFLPNH